MVVVPGDRNILYLAYIVKKSLILTKINPAVGTIFFMAVKGLMQQQYGVGSNSMSAFYSCHNHWSCTYEKRTTNCRRGTEQAVQVEWWLSSFLRGDVFGYTKHLPSVLCKPDSLTVTACALSTESRRLSRKYHVAATRQLIPSIELHSTIVKCQTSPFSPKKMTMAAVTHYSATAALTFIYFIYCFPLLHLRWLRSVNRVDG